MEFVDPGGDHLHILRNEGAVEAKTIAIQLILQLPRVGLRLQSRGTAISDEDRRIRRCCERCHRSRPLMNTPVDL